MHAFAHTVAALLAPPIDLARFLSGIFARVTGSPIGLYAIASAIVASLAVTLASGLWALVERKRAAARVERLSKALRQSRAALNLRNALLDTLPEAVVVMPTRTRKMLHFKGGKELLAHCLDGPDAAQLAGAMERLVARGTLFRLDVRTIALRAVAVRGYPVGDTAAIFLRADVETRAQAAAACWPAAAMAKPPVIRTVSLGKNLAPHWAGTVVIGADGRLRRYDKVFAERWSLAEQELSRAPHIDELAALSRTRNGRDAIWDIVASAVVSPEPGRHGEWGAQIDARGARISLSFSRLSGGDTLVTFDDDARRALAAAA